MRYLSLDVCLTSLPFFLSLSCSFDPSLSYEERERRMRQAAGRAGFVQDILLSTLLAD